MYNVCQLKELVLHGYQYFLFQKEAMEIIQAINVIQSKLIVSGPAHTVILDENKSDFQNASEELIPIMQKTKREL